ncbi:GSCOCG00011653001-RA-CDS [Cotesia congregata]|nr:GSCOCG00011653001-RA-CDS [Cotesia congregata]
MQGSEDPILSNSIIKMLDKEKRLSKDKTYKIHSELAACWNNIVSSGLEKDVKTSLIEKYPNKGNCSLSPPILNPELIPLLHKTLKLEINIYHRIKIYAVVVSLAWDKLFP